MATIDKTKSQTYYFLSKNKSIEDIKKQPNIEVKEKIRHGGKTFKLEDINDLLENNIENIEPVTSNLTNEVKEQETNNDIWTKWKNFLIPSISNTEETSKLQSIIEKQANEIQQLKKENKEVKQCNINFDNYKYNAITIYDEKQRKKTGIDKIHEEILPIEDKIFFITTFIKNNQSITENILYFQNFKNGNIKVFKQNKQYDNIDDYKKDITLINEISINNNYQYVPIKDFLKHHEELKSTPTKTEINIWIITWLIIPICVIIIGFIHPPILVVSIGFGILGGIFRGIVEVFLATAIKVRTWVINKINKWFKIKDEKIKNERDAKIKKTIENLTSDKLETKLQTQYDILKQELDNRKDKNPDELINSKTIKHNSNSIIQNSNIESDHNFDSSIRNTINHQEQQPATTSNHNWNKVKCLLTT